MFRSSFSLLKHSVKSPILRSNLSSFRWHNNRLCLFSSSIGVGRTDGGGRLLGLGFEKKERGNDDDMTFAEAKKLMRLVNVESLKMKLSTEGKEMICYSELLEACESMGVTKSVEEAKEFVRVLDEAGVVLLFRDKVYLHPDKVVDQVKRVVPLALTPEDDPRREELRVLQANQEEIDSLAHKQVRSSSGPGLGFH